VNINDISDRAVKANLKKVLTGLQNHADANAEVQRALLGLLVDGLLVPMNGAGWFGNEGWKAAFGIEDDARARRA
jgi:hypothetical protein